MFYQRDLTRKAIADIGGTMSENLPTSSKSLKDIEKERIEIDI